MARPKKQEPDKLMALHIGVPNKFVKKIGDKKAVKLLILRLLEKEFAGIE